MRTKSSKISWMYAVLISALWLITASAHAATPLTCEPNDQEPADDCFRSGRGHACLVTGNGFGFATIEPTTGHIVGLFAHPYATTALNHDGTEADGIATTNFIADGFWKTATQQNVLSVDYVSQSQVVNSTDGTSSNNSFFMPFGLNRSALFAIGSDPKACLALAWRHPKIKDESVSIGGRDCHVLRFSGVGEVLLAVNLDRESRPDTDFAPDCLTGGSSWALVSLSGRAQAEDAVGEINAWIGTHSARELAQKATAEATFTNIDDAARALGIHSPQEIKMFRSSRTILKMAQIAEPNDVDHFAHGLINASLPAGEFFMPFVRDMAYATTGLIDAGFRDDARSAVDAYLNAGPIGLNRPDVRDQKYQISTVRYYGDGSEDADFSGQEQRNLEFDNWGLALWAMGHYHTTFQDTAWPKTRTKTGTVYSTIRDLVVQPLLANLDPGLGNQGLIVARDTSVWEQNDEQRSHYAASTIAAIGGLNAITPMVKQMGDLATLRKVEAALKSLRIGFQATFMDGDQMFGRPALEDPKVRNRMDASVLEAINMGVITDEATIRKTLARMDGDMLVASGGYKRVVGGCDEYEKHEFVFADFNLARVYLRIGDLKSAEAIIGRLTEKAMGDHGIIPEMYVARVNSTFHGPLGSAAGAAPMVGYGAGSYMIYIAERHALEKMLHENQSTGFKFYDLDARLRNQR